MQQIFYQGLDRLRNFIGSFTQPSSTVSSAAWSIWALVIFLIGFQLYYNYTMNAFYHFGAPYADSGLFAHLLWRNDWVLSNPHYRGDFSYFGVHYSPALQIINLFSYFLPTHMPEYFAVWMAALLSGLGVIMLYVFRFLLYPKSQWHMLVLALLAIGITFNAVVTHTLWLPHFEYAMPVGIFLFLLFFRLRMHIPCAVAYVVTLLLREDAGFHLAAAFGLLLALQFYEKRNLKLLKVEIILLVAAIVHSIFALWLVGHIASEAGAQKVLSFIYLGDPPFSHIGFGLLFERLAAFAREHMAICIALPVTAIWSWRVRNPYLFIGFAANIPWILVNLLALNSNTGHLYAYYAFPVLLAFIWPFLGNIWRHGFPMPEAALRESFVLQIVLILIGIFSWDQGLRIAAEADARWGSYQVESGTDNRALMHDFVAKFNAGAGDLGEVIVDFPVLCLVADRYKGEFVRYADNDQMTADTIFYMDAFSTEPNQLVQTLIRKNNLRNKYCFKGMTLCLYTNRNAAQLADFGSSPMPAQSTIRFE